MFKLRFVRVGSFVAAVSLLAGVAGVGSALAAKSFKSAVLAAPPGKEAVFVDCGALLAEPGLGEAWPGPKAVRPGETLTPTDKGLGCRFVLAGKPGGEAVLVEVRLTRPTADAGGSAVDRWYVPARRGEPAAATYAFYPPGHIDPGPWRLELYEGDTRLAVQTFVAPAADGDAPKPVVGDQAASAPETVAAATPSVPAPPAAADEAPSPSPPSAEVPAAPAVQAPEPAPPAPPPVPVASAPQVPQPAPQPRSAPSRSARATTPEPAVKSSPAPQAAVRATRTKAPLPGTGFIALQTGLFADPQNAAGQAAKLRAHGFPACVVVEGQGAKARHRVLAGHFGDKRAALAARGEVRAAVGVAPLVFPVDAGQAAKLRCH